MFSFETEGFSCSLDVLYEGPGLSKLQFLIKFFFLYVIFSIFLVIKTLDPDWIRIRTHTESGSETLTNNKELQFCLE
jgi:hypothetical protein